MIFLKEFQLDTPFDLFKTRKIYENYLQSKNNVKKVKIKKCQQKYSRRGTKNHSIGYFELLDSINMERFKDFSSEDSSSPS